MCSIRQQRIHNGHQLTTSPTVGLEKSSRFVGLHSHGKTAFRNYTAPQSTSPSFAEPSPSTFSHLWAGRHEPCQGWPMQQNPPCHWGLLTPKASAGGFLWQWQCTVLLPAVSDSQGENCCFCWAFSRQQSNPILTHTGSVESCTLPSRRLPQPSCFSGANGLSKLCKFWRLPTPLEVSFPKGIFWGGGKANNFTGKFKWLCSHPSCGTPDETCQAHGDDPSRLLPNRSLKMWNLPVSAPLQGPNLSVFFVQGLLSKTIQEI